jgi:hypothetical protein
MTIGLLAEAMPRETIPASGSMGLGAATAHCGRFAAKFLRRIGGRDAGDATGGGTRAREPGGGLDLPGACRTPRERTSCTSRAHQGVHETRVSSLLGDETNPHTERLPRTFLPTYALVAGEPAMARGQGLVGSSCAVIGTAGLRELSTAWNWKGYLPVVLFHWPPTGLMIATPGAGPLEKLSEPHIPA